MKFIKPNKNYPDEISKAITIFKFKNIRLQVIENYKPHWLEFMIWRKDRLSGFYILKKWKKFPLNLSTIRLFKLNKLEKGIIKIKTEKKLLQIRKDK